MPLLFLTDAADPYTALDGNGNPVANATLEFYVAGTSEQAAVYSDSGLTTPITQPVTASALGVFTTIYLDSTISYRVIGKTADGKLLFDVDEYELEGAENRFRGPLVQALDTGVPVPGALMYCYENGTTTLQDSYADKNRLAKRPNPLTADAGGFFPPVWLGLLEAYTIDLNGTEYNDIGTLSPVISSLSPSSVNAGAAEFTLTITGENFTADCEARVGGSARTTVFNSATELEVTIPASDCTVAASLAITVVDTVLGLTSNTATLTVAGDAYWSSVSLLCGFDNGNGSSTYTDESSYARTLTADGGPTQVTSPAKFGASVGYFSGTPFVWAADSATLELASNDFTIECFVYPINLSRTHVLASKRNTGATQNEFQLQIVQTTGALQYVDWIGSGGTTGVNLSGGALTAGAWHHVAISRIGSNFYLCVNGSVVATATSAHAIGQNSEIFRICDDLTTPGRELNGYMDELRVTIGAGRYSGSYTVPTAKFPRGAA